MKTVFIVVPAYNEEGNILPFHTELKQVLSQLPGYKFQIVFVNDGSRDRTQGVLDDLIVTANNVTVIELSRNFGKEAAVSAGLQSISGADAVIIMDGDLQHPPSLIPEFIRQWENGYEVVTTRRVAIENQPMLRRLGSYGFYKLMDLVSETPMEAKTTDFRLIDRIVLDVIKTFTERNRMVRGLIDWVGFRRTVIEFEAPARFSGTATYSYRRLVALALNSITSFSLRPLKLTGYLGLLIVGFSALTLAVMAIDRMTGNYLSITNLAFVVVANTFLVGIILIALGLIALYIGNIHDEVQNRPLFVVRRRQAPRELGSPIR